MPRLPIFRLGSQTQKSSLPELTAGSPTLALEGLTVGVDNLRHDVVLSGRFVEGARTQIARLVGQYGGVKDLMADVTESPTQASLPPWMRSQKTRDKRDKRNNGEPPDWKTLLKELCLQALNRAKSDGNQSLDLLARLAMIKQLRSEMHQQFALAIERCNALRQNVNSLRPNVLQQYQERATTLKLSRKMILRKTAQDLFLTQREVEKESLARTRRSLFGQAEAEGRDESYSLLLSRLAFSEDGRDDYLCAEHYVMLGNWERDPDRYIRMREIVVTFVRSLYGEDTADDMLEGWIYDPENAHRLVGSGSPDASPDGQAQQQRLSAWVRLLEDEQVMECIIASYHVVGLLGEYSPLVNPQQLKNALISREECNRVERLIQENGKTSPASLYSAVSKVAGCRGAERAKIAARFLFDFLRYHRDLRRLETLNTALDTVNLASASSVQELSRLNGTLYEFLLPDEQGRHEDVRILRHVVLKADVRDSTRLTRTLTEKGLNPASYFSLNFYGPVNKLLGKYGAEKVFLEGDALILAILEREGEASLAVSRTCVLAREIIEIVSGYNAIVQRTGMPGLELGIGITLQESAPLYLMDGDRKIMISEALNESDRLSGCHKQARKVMESDAGFFRVYAFQVADVPEGASPEDFTWSYNLGGIRMNEAAFRKMQQEVSLQPMQVRLRTEAKLSASAEYRLYSGVVPVDRDIFRSIVVRESRVPRMNPADFSFMGWTDRTYYEVCTDPAIYAALEKHATNKA
jgi:hypothetical protein